MPPSLQLDPGNDFLGLMLVACVAAAIGGIVIGGIVARILHREIARLQLQCAAWRAAALGAEASHHQGTKDTKPRHDSGLRGEPESGFFEDPDVASGEWWKRGLEFHQRDNPNNSA